MRTTSRTRWGILLALGILVAASGAGAGKSKLPPLPAGGQTIGGPGTVSLPSQARRFLAWFAAPVPACITVMADADGALEVDSEGSFARIPLVAAVSTTCQPDMRSVILDCPAGCRAVWRVDQLEETVR